MTVRAAIYARVSSATQRDAHTIESQLRVLRAFVAGQGWALVDTYVDDGKTAKTGKLEARDGFARCAADAEAKRFDVLVVVDIDRLTRTDDMLERAAILGPFQRAGIDIVTPSGGRLDLRTMFGELSTLMQALGAAEWLKKHRERIIAGKARALAEGRKPAGPTPFGLAYSREMGAWSIDEPAAAIQREIFQRIAGGESCVRIADDLARRPGAPAPRTGWTRAAVYRLVRKRTACGEWEADKKRGVVIRVPAVVTEEEWQDAARALLAHRRRGLVRTKHVYLLERLARCAACGAPIRIRSATRNSKRPNSNPSPAAYVCRDRQRGTCDARIVKCAELDDRVWAAISDELAQPDLLAALADVGRARAADARDWTADAEAHRAHLARLEKVEGAVMARFRRGLVSEGALDAELAAIGRERAAVRDQLATAERALGATASAQDRLRAAGDALAQLRDALPLATPEQRRALLRELAHDGGVVIDDGRARLDLRLLRPAEATSRDGAGGASPRIALVMRSGYRKQHGANRAVALRIRRVA
jgi:DNA invertase Pin-like site-specific DNA recombinase